MTLTYSMISHLTADTESEFHLCFCRCFFEYTLRDTLKAVLRPTGWETLM